ncbi:MAG: protein tyrosine phosphatase [bacterium]|nr:protein tyrosine phosphatase [bacterium]
MKENGREVRTAVKTEEIAIIDVHAHILPEVDDGARNMEEALTMARLAVGQGIRHVIATSHSLDRGENIPSERVMYQAELLCKELKKKEIPLKISTGQEIFYFDRANECLKNGTICTMAGSSYVLVEFFPKVSFRELYQGVRKLQQARYWPILAHVERYACLRSKEQLAEMSELGVYMQMNYTSLEGNFWNRDTQWCRKVLEAGQIHFLGTDMHRSQGSRAPQTQKAMEWMRRKLPESRVRELVWDNPQKILRGEKIEL